MSRINVFMSRVDVFVTQLTSWDIVGHMVNCGLVVITTFWLQFL